MVLQDVLRSFLVILSGLWVVSPVFGEKPSVAKPAKPPVVPTSVAVFGLGGAVSEGPGGGDLSSLLSGTAPESLRSLVSRMDRAGRDKQVAAVALLYNGPVVGSAQLEELVSAVDRLRETGKPVYLLAESMGTGGYVLASHCSHLSVVPGGELALVGLATESPYIRGLLDWLGVEPDFLTCGDFKSAGEMYMREGPSRNAAAMGDRLLDSQYRTYVDLIASGRNVDRKQVRHWIDQGPYTASRARAAGLIDAVEHRREFYDRMRRAHGQTSRLLTRYGLPPRQQVDLSSPLGLIQFYSKLLQGPGRVVNRGDTIAMVYLEGTIVGGSMPISPTGGAAASSETLRKTLAVVERDKAIKAVVLRIDSPGGSALASEVILDAIRKVQANKPVIVSMGNVAASGGYYVASYADEILAQPTTITGSIGVVGGKFATTGLWDKLGIKWASRSRGANATLNGTARVFTDDQRDRVQEQMDEIYGTFKRHVVDGRGKKLKKPIEQIAGGRVYTGRQALELGLVDRMGGQVDAIAAAAKRAGIRKYTIREYPESQGLFDSLMGTRQSDRSGPLVGRRRGRREGVRLLDRVVPLLGTLEPQRAEAIRRIVGHLERLQHERVFLLAPEIRIDDGR
ncbi:MAG: signal peptide peptidase SppA [Planctomycetales bacterium]|nr:signal peptide peptidase SppA [Planctomycetales bacterium]|tara:strand:+ start:5365 stop:7236 length:1872 start_codon:yes stop_codon:yes gene_type:complete